MNLNQKKFIQIGCIVLAAVLLLTGISSIAFVLASPKSQPGAQTMAAATDLGYGTVTLVFRQGNDRVNMDNGTSHTNEWYNETNGEYVNYRNYVQERYDAWDAENSTQESIPAETNAAAPAAEETTETTATAETVTQQAVETANAAPEETTAPAETTAATESAQTATESTDKTEQAAVSQTAPALKAAAPAITPTDIPETLQIFEEFSIVVPINASGNIVIPGTTFAETLAQGGATLTDQAKAWQLDPETFWFGDPSDTDALENGKLWAYSFTGWSAAYNGDGNDTRYVHIDNTVQPGDVVVQGAHTMKLTDSAYGTLGSSITIKNGATIVLDATWGQCSFMRNPYDTMVYKEMSYNNNNYKKYVADTDKCTNNDGSKELKAWDYKDANGVKQIYDGRIFSTTEIGTVETKKGTLTLNYGNDPNNPIASIDYLYGYRYKYETAENGYFRYVNGTSYWGYKRGDVIAQNAYHRVVMLTDTLDYIKHNNQYSNGYGRDYTITYYGNSKITNKCGGDNTEYYLVDIYTSATYKSLQADQNASTDEWTQNPGKINLYRYRSKSLSNAMWGNYRFDNIRMCGITSSTEGTAAHGTDNLVGKLNVAESSQAETSFNWSYAGGIGNRYFETTARFKTGLTDGGKVDNSGALTILRPGHSLKTVKVNGGYFSTLEVGWSGYIPGTDSNNLDGEYAKDRWWLVGRRVDINTIRAGTSFSEPEPVQTSSGRYQVMDDNSFKLVVTGGWISNSIYGSSSTSWGYCRGSRELSFYGDPSQTAKGTEYNPHISNSSNGIYGANYASVFSNVTINIKNCTVGGSIYGGGYAASGNIYGDVTMNIANSTIEGSVFGGGMMGNIYQKRSEPFLGDGFGTDPGANGTGGGNVTLNISGTSVKGHVYGGGKGGTLTQSAASIVGIDAAINQYPSGWYDTPVGPRGLGSPAYVAETGQVIYCVFKWAKSLGVNGGSMYNYERTATLSLAIVEKNATVNITGGRMYKNVYGSGNLGQVLGNATVKITGGCQVDGDVYGAGDGVTQPSGVTVYTSDFGNNTYTPPTYTVDSAGNVKFTLQKVNGKTDSNIANGYVSELSLGTFTWSSDPAVLEKGGIDRDKKLMYSPYMTGWGLVGNDTSVTVTGSTVKGIVYGGGNKGEVQGKTTVTVSGSSTIGGGTTSGSGSVYGGGNEATVGKSATVTITGSTVKNAVFGGGRSATVTQNTTVTVNGASQITNWVFGGGNAGVVGGSATVTVGGTATIGQTVYGGGNSAAVNNGTTVTVQDTAKVTDSVIGGGNKAGVTGNANTTIKGSATVNAVYGGGNKGAVTGNATITVQGSATVNSNVYGGGNAGAVSKNTTVNVEGGTLKAMVFGGGNGTQATVGGNSGVVVTGGTFNAAVYGAGNAGAVTGNSSVTASAGLLKSDLLAAGYQGDVGGSASLSLSGSVEVKGFVYGGGHSADVGKGVTVQITGGTTNKSVFGGGYEGDVTGDVNMTISGGTLKTSYTYGAGNRGNVSGNVTVNITGGNVYGLVAGALNANVGGNIQANLSGGTITASVYGGNDTGGTIGPNNKGRIELNVSGTTVITNNIYSGGYSADFDGTVNLNISGGTGGKIKDNGDLSGGFVFGGGAKAAVGDINVTVTGGTYNYLLAGGDGSTLSGGRIPADVNGDINVLIGGDFVLNGFFRGGGMRFGTISGDITVNMTGGTIKNTAYAFSGGCHGIDYDSAYGGADTHVLGDITVNIVGGTIKGHVYGGSLGPYGQVNNPAGLAAVTTDCSGNITLNISGNANLAKNVYGGTAAANVHGRVVTNIGGAVTIDGTTYTANGLTIGGSVYGGNEKYGNVFGEDSDAAPIEVNVAGGTINGSVYGGHYMGGVVGDGLASENTVLNISGGAVKGSVYGGSQEVDTPNVATKVTVSNTNNTAKAIAITGSVFGGGYNGEVSSTDVKLQNTSSCAAITVGGDVFGGGKGSMSSSGTTARVLNQTNVLIDLYTNLTATETSSSVDDLSGEAKVTPSITVKNVISGSVYGGGDIAQVGVGIINRGSNSATVTEPGSTRVQVKSGNILGSVFGGGNGVPTSGTYDVDMGTVFGSTHVDITGGYVHTNVYGGGRQSHLYAPTVDNVVGKASEVHIDQTGNGTIVIGGSVFGGGDRGEGASLNAAAPTVVGDTDVRITGSPTNCKVYFIRGGVYGDGNLCVVKGTRIITMKDFTTGNTDYLKTFFSLQRADKVILDNTDIVLQGALDLVDEGDATLYSVNRVDSLEMRNGSTIKLTSIVKYLGALSSDVETAREFIKEGNNGTNGYTDVPPVSPLTDSEVNAYRADTTRAKNTVCVANGLYLEVIRQSDGEYGPVTGLYTLQLLRAVPGEGGGFVYADIATSTGDFICETKKANSNVYLNVIDNVGGLVDGVGTYYYWYINGETISYSTTVTAHIGMADTAFSSSFYIPEHSDELEYVLFGVNVNDVLANAVLGNPASLKLVQQTSGLKDNEIAIELRLDGVSMGFLKYEDGVWCVELSNGSTMSGYDGKVINISQNTLRSNVTVGNGKGKVDWVLHKSTAITSELRGMQVNTEIDLFDKQGNIYSAGTGILVLSADMNIVRLNPSQSFYRVDSRFFGQGISPDKEVSITGKSAFTVEFHTYYVPLAYPGTMTWSLKTTENRYYVSRQGGWVTTDAAGNVIAYSSNTKPTKNNAGEYVAGDEVFTLQSTGNPVSNALPKGTKIIMIDATGGDREYYYYLCNEATTEISLSNFCLMGTKSSISSQYSTVKPDFMAVYDSQSATRVDETLFFIFDFSQVTWSSNAAFSGGVVLEHLYSGLDIMDHVKVNQSGTSTSYVRDFPEAARYQVNPATDAVDSMTVNATGGENVTLTVQVNRDSAWTNTQFNEQKYALRIEWMNGQTTRSMPNGLYATYGGRNYYPSNGNMDVVVPLSISETSYTSTHQITIDSILGALSDSLSTGGTLRVTLYNAANGSYYNQLTTGLSGTAGYTLNKVPETALGVACTNDNRIFAPNEVMQFKYKAIGSTENVTVRVEKKVNGKYGEVALSSVFSNATANLAPGTDLSKAWTVTGSAGTYRLVFVYADRTEYMNIVIR